MSLVHIVEEGERAQMSKRSGDFVSLDELLDDIGVDATRWFMLWRSHETTVDLDLDLARSQSSENPVYYVQYAHARIASILRKAGEAAEAAGAGFDPEAAGAALEPSEKALIKRLLEFPERGARVGGPPGAAPDLRLLDRGRRRLPRLLPRLPGGRRRGGGGRALAAGALPLRRSGRSPPRWGCSGSRPPSGCDAPAGAPSCPSSPRSPARPPARRRVWSLRRSDLEALAQLLSGARRAAGSSLVTGDERAVPACGRPGRCRRAGGRRTALLECDLSRPAARRRARARGRARACTSTCAGRRRRREILQPLALAGPAAAGASAPLDLRRRRRVPRRTRRRCSAPRASAT